MRNLIYPKKNLNFLLRKLWLFKHYSRNYSYMMETKESAINVQEDIREGDTKIRTAGKVFYNPVQEFNRDLSITVLSAYAQEHFEKNLQNEEQPQKGIKHKDGLTILEALSATGLRSIRYAKEIPGIKEVIANDISLRAVEDIKNNISYNQVENLVTASREDATMLMYQHRTKDKKFDVIDLDPYGCPSIFLDSAVQAVKDGGLLLVTATDMAVLAGNSPETCYSKYGAISLKIKACHEMALRILLKCIESHANRYSRYIVPLLSISADFYIRVFVKVFTGANKCKETLSKLSTVYHCTGCGTYLLQPLGTINHNHKNKQLVKYGLPTQSPKGRCEHCEHPYHIGGPIWTAPMHCPEFVNKLLHSIPSHLNTHKRIQGILSMISEELIDAPLYYTLQHLSGTLHVETPAMATVRSAILNAGYRVSYTHMNKTSIKTNAPSKFIWDMMRCWESRHPISGKHKTGNHENAPHTVILSKKPETAVNFEHHPDAEPESKRLGFLRFQQNPTANWGPGTRSTAMVGGEKLDKSRRNQGKRKRGQSEESDEVP